MGIRVIRICDLCGAEHKQIITQLSSDEYTCPVGFVCSDCILKENQAE